MTSIVNLDILLVENLLLHVHLFSCREPIVQIYIHQHETINSISVCAIKYLKITKMLLKYWLLRGIQSQVASCFAPWNRCATNKRSSNFQLTLRTLRLVVHHAPCFSIRQLILLQNVVYFWANFTFSLFVCCYFWSCIHLKICSLGKYVNVHV